MIDQQQLEILDHLYKCILKPSGLADLTERLSDDLGCLGINMLLGDKVHKDLNSSWVSHQLSPLFEDFLQQGLLDRELGYIETIFETIPEPELTSDLDIERRHNQRSGNKIDNTELRAWLARRGIKQRYLTYLNAHPTIFDSICLNFPDRPQHEIEAAVQRCASYLPHLSNLMVSARPFLLLKARFNAVLNVLDRFRLAVFLLTPQGEVVETNQAAKDILQQGDGISLSPRSQLKLTDQDATQKLAGAIAGIATNRSGIRQPARMLIPRASLATAYIGEISPILHEEVPVGSMMIVTDPDNTAIISTDHFGEIFGLTQAEQSICQLLSEGHKSGTIAEMRSTSIETVRGQIKSVLNKTRTNHQTDLIRLALSVNIPVDNAGTE